MNEIHEIPRVSYDRHFGIATFQGPGGFTQLAMPEPNAKAVAQALGIDCLVYLGDVQVFERGKDGRLTM